MLDLLSNDMVNLIIIKRKISITHIEERAHTHNDSWHLSPPLSFTRLIRAIVSPDLAGTSVSFTRAAYVLMIEIGI